MDCTLPDHRVPNARFHPEIVAPHASSGVRWVPPEPESASLDLGNAGLPATRSPDPPPTAPAGPREQALQHPPSSGRLPSDRKPAGTNTVVPRNISGVSEKGSSQTFDG